MTLLYSFGRLGQAFIKFLYSFAGLPSSEVASTVFTVGTAAVLPFYTVMVVAPKAELVRFLKYFQS